MAALATTRRLQDTLGPAPRPSEVAGLAALLVAHAREELTIEELESGASAFLDRRIAEWFAVLGEPARSESTE